MAKHQYLCYTNQLLIVSLLYFLFNKQKTTAWMEYVLASLLVITILFSQLFWKNPIKQSVIHRIDAIVAKISIFSFVLYTLIYKFKYSFLLVLFAFSISAYYSHLYSSQEWCCDKHLFSHGCLHIICFIATFYAFWA
jgi:hypothetical protein